MYLEMHKLSGYAYFTKGKYEALLHSLNIPYMLIIFLQLKLIVYYTNVHLIRIANCIIIQLTSRYIADMNQIIYLKYEYSRNNLVQHCLHLTLFYFLITYLK